MLEYVTAAAHAVGGEAAIMIYKTQKEADMEPPGHVAAAMRESNVIISFPLMYILSTKAYIKTLKAGARILELTRMNPEMMIRLIGKVDYEALCELENKLRGLTVKARGVKVETAKGTNIVF